MNPAKLSPERRDAICMQCHMEGRVSIERAGRHIYDFQPGDSLSDYVRYYVLTGAPSERIRRGEPGRGFGAERVQESFRRQNVVHQLPRSAFHALCRGTGGIFSRKVSGLPWSFFAAKHHAEHKDCTACHMPESPSKDVAHTEVTDHRIPRVPALSPQLLQDTNASASKPELAPFPDTKEAEDDLRDLALAWESLANSGISSARPQAEKLLRQSSQKFPDDSATIAALAYEDQLHGDVAGARALYQRALAENPTLIDAATNLGVIEAQSGNFPVAVQLLQGAFSRAPWQSSVGIDLARVFCFAGRPEQGQSVLDRVLEFNPDMKAAKRLRDDLSRSKPPCSGK